ncbi:DNA polymerase/3'-5' exonuclease PolX [Candidatus Uhrbacteria bacterium]|nr:DNA polymerase/3'-5' exonuclease PolX [Candidatus Uhrbacteria bacterium]
MAVMHNQRIARLLNEMSEYLEVQDIPFKPQAYARAAGVIAGMTDEATDIYDQNGKKGLDGISGVGRGIAEKIEEFITTGRIKELEQMKKKFPVNVSELSAVQGVGPKKIAVLYKKLKIKNCADLERAVRHHTVAALPHFGKKSEEQILKGIEFLKKGKGRMLLGTVLPLAQDIEARLKKVPGIKQVIIAGSIRRRQETIGDIDIVATTAHPKRAMDAFISLPEVELIYSSGATKTMVRLSLGIDADLRVVSDDCYGAALQYFTGDKQHNIEVRKIAIKKGYKFSEYGLFKGKKLIAAKTEEEIYQKLGLAYMPPELRTASGEIEQARRNGLPDLIPYGSIRGDLQVQTNWTDGNASIEEMATAAIKAGLEYIAITDHTTSLAMTGGLDEKKLAKQAGEIDRLNRTLRTKKFRILKSAEVNIMKDGTLDISDAMLKKLDLVCVAAHSHFALSEEDQTKRIIQALKHPLVNILFHPTGRRIGRREPYALDMGKIIRAAKQYGVCLEANASPDRLDLKDTHIRMAVEHGVKLVVDSDAHAPGHFDNLDLGVAQVRRGWGKRSDVFNTLPVEKLLVVLKKLKKSAK